MDSGDCFQCRFGTGQHNAGQNDEQCAAKVNGVSRDVFGEDFTEQAVPHGKGTGMEPEIGGTMTMIIIVVFQIVLPAVITLAVSEFMRKKGWIKDGDMKLEL